MTGGWGNMPPPYYFVCGAPNVYLLGGSVFAKGVVYPRGIASARAKGVVHPLRPTKGVVYPHGVSRGLSLPF